MIIYPYITIYLGKFHHDRTLFSGALGIMVRIREIIPFYGRKIQVSEILYFTQAYLQTSQQFSSLQGKVSKKIAMETGSSFTIWMAVVFELSIWLASIEDENWIQLSHVFAIF